MSAFMVSDDHITALCTFACDTPGVHCSIWIDGRPERASGRHLDMFRLLKQANYDSLTARYGDEPSTADERLGRLQLSPLAIVKACDCLEYQCCEVSNWRDTDAARTIDYVRTAAIYRLPGYDAADWRIEEGTADYRMDRYPSESL
jgi:hypothetical protein